MPWLKQFIARKKTFSDLSDEIQQHLDEKTEALMAEGMSREDAQRAARREFGNVTRIQERSREAWMLPLAERLWADVRFAIRQLRRLQPYSAWRIRSCCARCRSPRRTG
jgi:uncharacterized protein YoaH (UPF0181 family)